MANTRHEAWREQVAENSPRLATVHVMYDTTGWGEFLEPKMFDFRLTFIEEPAVTHGYALAPDQDLVALRYPRAWGGVSRFDTDERGYYSGAWCFMICETVSAVQGIQNVPAKDPGYVINHYFTFTGIAIKDLSEDLFDG